MMSGAMALTFDSSFLEPWRRGGPGGVAALMIDGEVVFSAAEGLADLDARRPFTADTPFHICSCTKQYTAAALLLLEAEGRLSLDDDIHRYVPQLAYFGAPITLRHLVTNTSGLRDYLAMPALATGRPARRVTEEMTRDLIFGQRSLMFAPGAAFRYSNTNFALLGWAIERVCGRTLAECFDDMIFAPLGMTKTCFLVQSNPGPADGAVGYEGGGDAGFHAPNLEIYEAGDGGVWSTLADLVRWEETLLRPRIGTPALWARFAAPTRLSDGRESWYGLGHGTGVYRGAAWFGHAGGLSGMTVNRAHYPGGRISAIAAGNSGLIDAETATFALAGSALGGADDAPPTLAPVPPEAIARWTGVYQSDDGAATLVLENREGGLFLKIHRAEARLGLAADGALADEGGWFRVSGNGEEASLVMGRGAAPRLMRRAPPPPADGGFTDVCGVYRSAELGARYRISPRDGALWAHIEGPWGGSGSLPLIARAFQVFEAARADAAGALRPAGVTLTFRRGRDGAMRMIVSTGGAEGLVFEGTGE